MGKSAETGNRVMLINAKKSSLDSQNDKIRKMARQMIISFLIVGLIILAIFYFFSLIELPFGPPD